MFGGRTGTSSHPPSPKNKGRPQRRSDVSIDRSSIEKAIEKPRLIPNLSSAVDLTPHKHSRTATPPGVSLTTNGYNGERDIVQNLLQRASNELDRYTNEEESLSSTMRTEDEDGSVSTIMTSMSLSLSHISTP